MQVSSFKIAVKELLLTCKGTIQSNLDHAKQGKSYFSMIHAMMQDNDFT